MMNKELHAMLMKLAWLQSESASSVEFYQSEIESLQDTIATLKTHITTAQEPAKKQRQAIIALSLEVHTETGDKHPHPRITVATTNKLVYDRKKALAWAQEHAPQHVKTTLSVSPFEKALRAGSLGFMTKMEAVPQVKIPSDLSDMLDGE